MVTEYNKIGSICNISELAYMLEVCNVKNLYFLLL